MTTPAQRIHKFGKISLTYDLTLKDSEKLVIIFPAVDSVAARNSHSYYGFHDILDANVVTLADNFGAHGCYLMSVSGDVNIQNSVLSLIKTIVDEIGVHSNKVLLAGSSKGATMALLYSFLLGRYDCISAEPQIRIGDFLFAENKNLALQSIAYAMTGRVSEEDIPGLNNLFFQSIANSDWPSHQGIQEILFGNPQGIGIDIFSTYTPSPLKIK